MTDKNLPVNYDEVLAGLAKKATATEKPSTSSINAKAGMLLYNGTAAPGNKMEVIIIASTHTNLYYEDAYDPNDIKNPVCYAYSEDPDVIEMKPHPKSSKPQSETCATCWANQWNTDPKGGKGKACKNTRRLACIPADVEAADIPTAEIATMSLPVMTVSKQWSPYVHKLSALYNRPPLAVKTQLGIIPDVKSQFQVTFDDVGMVDVSLLGALLDRMESVMPLLEREYEANVEVPEGEKPAARQRGKSAKY